MGDTAQLMAGCVAGLVSVGFGDAVASENRCREISHEMRRQLSTDKGLSGPGLGNLLGVLICAVLAATAAGLTMGIVSLDALELRVVMRTGTSRERSDAARLLPLVDRTPRHHVLVTLLLLNSVANEAMPIFLDSLVPDWAAIVISVTAVLFFGEIAPSAVFTGPQKLRVAAGFSPVVTIALVALSPLAWPIALLLDRLLPEDVDKKYSSRQEVRAMVDVQREAARATGDAEPFSEDEADLVRGAMSLSSTSVADVMLPLARVFTLQADQPLDQGVVRAIYDAGFSRIPVTDQGGLTGQYLLVKDVLPDIANLNKHNKNIAQLPMRDPVWIGPDHSLFDLLNEFQTGRTHMAFVKAPETSVNPPALVQTTRHRSLFGGLFGATQQPTTSRARRTVLGILTLEDVLEQILTEPIYDEADRANAAEVIRNFFIKHVLPSVRQRNRSSLETHSTVPLLTTHRPRRVNSSASSTNQLPPQSRSNRSAFSEKSTAANPVRRPRRSRYAPPNTAQPTSPPPADRDQFSRPLPSRRSRPPYRGSSSVAWSRLPSNEIV